MEGRGNEVHLLIAFDLEGPLSTQDNAYEVMGLIERGSELFERISRYDDLLTLEGRPDYEPGDTLSLILPFLLAHGVTEDDIRHVSARAPLVPGARECIAQLKSAGHKIVIISTSYAPHALNIAAQLDVPADDVACTPAPLSEIRQCIGEASCDIEYLRAWQNRILEIPLDNDDQLKRELDRFYWHELPQHPSGRALRAIKVVGGTRKVDALQKFAQREGAIMEHVVAIGDSITDFKMLQAVEDGKGLAIVFNGNQYAIPYGTIGVAGMSLEAILPAISAFTCGGRDAVREFVANQPNPEDGPIYHWLPERAGYDDVLTMHKRFRAALRGRAAQLG